MDTYGHASPVRDDLARASAVDSVLQQRRNLRPIEDADQLRHLAFEGDGETEEGHEVGELQAAFHGADVGRGEAGSFGERFLRVAGGQAELFQPLPEQLGRCRRSAHVLENPLTNVKRERMPVY
jgi:hypothetical protein